MTWNIARGPPPFWEYLGQIPGLFSAGRQGFFLHNNIDHSIHIGLAAAKRLLSDPSAPPKDWYAQIETFRFRE